RWLRNVAVALGNALRAALGDPDEQARIRDLLDARAEHPSELVREHVAWALAQAPQAADAPATPAPITVR
ncbi:MAG: hypothetical protein EOO24_16690, partial [Comamonadaceae bacterium]